MNRHRAYWSAMGPEPATEERPLSDKELQRRLSELVVLWGINAVITGIRKIWEENNK